MRLVLQNSPHPKNVMHRGPRVAILTFHNTPNFGAMLQCYALYQYLTSMGAVVEVINYTPVRAMLQYAKSLFIGRRRSLRNIVRILEFARFFRKSMHVSGPPIFRTAGLAKLSAKGYDVVFAGSDEIWKVDHIRSFDVAYYLSFLDPSATRLVAYAATASTVTDLRDFADRVLPLLRRFSAITVRDRATKRMVDELLGESVVEVIDPTLVWDFRNHPLPPLTTGAYVAVYSWLSAADMRTVRAFAAAHSLKVVCVGCTHPLADENFIGIGPEQWMSLIKHSAAVVTDFFHGVLFALIFQRPLYAYVDAQKRMKLEQALAWVGLSHHLHATVDDLVGLELTSLDANWDEVFRRLRPLQESSRRFLDEQLMMAVGSDSVSLGGQASKWSS